MITKIKKSPSGALKGSSKFDLSGMTRLVMRQFNKSSSAKNKLPYRASVSSRKVKGVF